MLLALDRPTESITTVVWARLELVRLARPSMAVVVDLELVLRLPVVRHLPRPAVLLQLAVVRVATVELVVSARQVLRRAVVVVEA